jgi:lipopolysaccharide export system permease protein
MFRIKKLDIFITKQFGLLFVGTFFICLFVLMMQFLWRYVDELIGKGLSLEILAQFFWYMGLGLMPQAFPLAILLSSLITYGNLGESSELTAIKAAGISLMQSMRSLIVITSLIACISFFFQDVVVPHANVQFSQLLISMKQKSPELEIPEGIFYDGIPGSNLYVEKKDLNTGHLYGIMIYRQSNSYEDQTIILADSGMLQSTAEKKHLLLTLCSVILLHVLLIVGSELFHTLLELHDVDLLIADLSSRAAVSHASESLNTYLNNECKQRTANQDGEPKFLLSNLL